MQNIALNIVLNGVPTAIANLTQFEEVLAAARVQLSQLEIGSQSFKKLSAEIKTADNTLRELKKQTEGKDLEGRLGDFGKLGGAIGSSFAAATAAIQLFGNNSEESLAAVTAAQNALTIALAARGVAEGAVVVKTVANDIATKALAASTANAGTATGAFYAILAANPYGAIIAAVGILIGLFATLTSDTEDATKAQKEFNDALTKDISKETTNFTILADRVRNVNLSLESRKKAIEELRKIAPNYFKNLSDEEILQSNLKDAVDDVTEALIKQSTARALQTRVEENANKILAARDAVTAAVREETRARENLLRVQEQASRGAFGQGTAAATLTAAKASQVATENVAKATKNLNELNAKRKSDLLEIQKIDKEIDAILGGTFEKEEKVTKEKEKQEAIDVRALERIRLQNEATEKSVKSLEAALSFQAESKPPQLEAQKNALNEILSVVSQLTGITETVSDKLNKIIQGPKQQQDTFKEIVLNFQNIDKLSNEILPLTQKRLSEIFGEKFSSLLKEQQTDIQGFFNKILVGAEKLSQVVDANNKPFLNAKQSLDLFKNALITAGQLQQKVNEGVINQDQKRLELQQSILLEFYTQANLQKEFTELQVIIGKKDQALYDSFLQRNNLAKQLVGIVTESAIKLEDFRAATDDSAVNIAKGNIELEKTQAILKGILAELSPEQAGQFIKQLGFDFETGLTYIVKNAEKLGPEITKSLLGGLDNVDVDLQKMTLKQVRTFKETLLAAGTDLEKYGVDIEQTFDKTFTKVNQTIKDKFINGVLDGIQQFQAVLNTLSQTLSMSFAQQFDTLEKRYKRIQEGIVGDSVEANQKRLEAEKAYQAERTRLEKQQAKTTLRISLAQALANTAEAITKLAAITGGIGAVVAGGAVAALNAVQVGIIASQLANIDSYRRGGIFTKKQGGGFVTGPSHEYGGVKFQSGGVELEGNESIINRVSTVNYMGLLDQINQAGGGKPIYPNFDDSRIVEAIAKQRNTPIRAYVVESDITAKQETARRLERLSQI